ncbi:MAG TPA: porin [Aquabacterium sp.]|nr:porin [Aquabacterium sp.]
MKRTMLSSAVVLAIALMGASVAHAQSSVTLYGNIDVAVDHAHKGAGRNSIQGLGLPEPRSQSLSRVSPSISSVNQFGFKGEENLGDGMKSSFVMEGEMRPDVGALNNDGRIFGRQIYVGLTTPAGEVRLGRQYAPMFYAYALTTIDQLGATDVYAGAITANNLQIRQDNQISYWAKSGPFMGELTYSPNAGVNSRVSAARAVATSLPPASATTGEILGGATAAAESTSDRGRTFGLLLAYRTESMTLTGAYHQNKFDVDVGIPVPTFLPLFTLKDYQGAVLAGKFVLPEAKTQLAVSYHYGNLNLSSAQDAALKSATLNTVSFGVRQPLDEKLSIGAEGAYSKFSNFTKGGDNAIVVLADYQLSKRSALYLRAGQTKDFTGSRSVAASTPGLSVIGGPLSGLASLGSLETPLFAGLGVNAGGRTSIAAVGIRYSF